jgi:hypothetical protein
VAGGQCRCIGDMEGEDERQTLSGILDCCDQLGLMVMHKAGQCVGERLSDAQRKLRRLIRCRFPAEQQGAVPEQTRPQNCRRHVMIALLQPGQRRRQGATMQQLAQFVGLSLTEMQVHVHDTCAALAIEGDPKAMPRAGDSGPRLAGQPDPEVSMPRWQRPGQAVRISRRVGAVTHRGTSSAVRARCVGRHRIVGRRRVVV